MSAPLIWNGTNAKLLNSGNLVAKDGTVYPKGAASLTSGSVPYWDGTKLNEDNANLFWDATNHRLGIGTATPGSRLDIKGAGATAATSSLNVTNSSSGSLLFVQDDGKVGISTSTPSVALDVGGGVDSNINGVLIEGGRSLILRDATKFYESGGLVMDTGNAARPIRMLINGTEKARLDTAGNFGIGTTIPGSLLQVATPTIGVTDLLRLEHANDATSGAGIGFWSGTAAETGRIVSAYESANNSGLRFYTYNGGLTEKVRIQANGSVGIGTGGPASKLEIKGVGTTSSTSSLNVTNSSSTSLLFVEDDGKVGIGTISPQNVLHVNGATQVDGTLFFNGASDYIYRPSLGTLNTGSSLEVGANLVVNREQHAATNSIILRVRSTTGQTSNLTDWENDVGTPLASITASGQIKLTGGTPGSGKVLTSDTVGLASWAALNAPQGVTAVSSNITLTNLRIHLVDTSSARSLTLPSPSATSFIVVKDKTGSCATNNITVVRAASEKIETVAASYVLNTDLGSWTFVSDGTDWFIV